MSYFDIIPREIVTGVYPRLDSASRFTFWRTYHESPDWIIHKHKKGFCIHKSKWINGIYTREEKIIPFVRYYDICKHNLNFANYFLNCNIMKEEDVLRNAAAAGNISIIEVLLPRMFSSSSDILDRDEFVGVVRNVLVPALSHGKLNSVLWLEDYLKDKNEILVRHVEGNPYRMSLKSILHMTDEYASICVDNGHIRCLNYLYDADVYDLNNTDYILSAVSLGHVRVLRWFKSKGMFRLNSSMRGSCLLESIRHDKTKMFKWLIDHGCELDIYTFIASARQGNLEILQMICGGGFTMDCLHSYEIDNTIIDYLISIKCPGWEKYI